MHATIVIRRSSIILEYNFNIEFFRFSSLTSVIRGSIANKVTEQVIPWDPNDQYKNHGKDYLNKHVSIVMRRSFILLKYNFNIEFVWILLINFRKSSISYITRYNSSIYFYTACPMILFLNIHKH